MNPALLFRPPCICLCTWRQPLLCRTLFGGNKEQTDEKRKQIWAEIDKGYFADLHEFRRNRGKRTESHDQLSSSGESVLFPSVSGKSLSGESLTLPPRGVVSLILVSMRGLGMAMCDQYRAPFEREFAGKQAVQVLELSLLDKAMFRLISGWVQRNLKKKLDCRRHSSFLVCSEGVEQLRGGLALGNSIVGYAYLVDREGLIRWRAHASPTEREVRGLIKCTRKLLDSSKNSHSQAHR